MSNACLVHPEHAHAEAETAMSGRCLLVAALQLWADFKGPGCPQCLDLTRLYEQLLDAKKTGNMVQVPRHLKDVPKPQWWEDMEAEEAEGDHGQLRGSKGACAEAGRACASSQQQQAAGLSVYRSDNLSIIGELYELITLPRKPNL